MFKKVLLSEDIDTISQGVMAVMDALRIDNVQQAQYCDDAYLKIKKGVLDSTPFDLLITDLSFKVDHRKQSLPSGEALIEKVRKEFPELKIIVYSVDDRAEKIRTLIRDFKVNGYVAKGRSGLRELENAIVSAYRAETYLSPELDYVLRSKPEVEILDSDITMLQMLSEGNSQDQISHRFKKENISPSSLSSIEKRLNRLRMHFGANNAIHLVAIVKDLGLI